MKECTEIYTVNAGALFNRSWFTSMAMFHNGLSIKIGAENNLHKKKKKENVVFFLISDITLVSQIAEIPAHTCTMYM